MVHEGKNLKKILRIKGITHEVFAKTLKTSRTTINGLFRDVKISDDYRADIEKVIGIGLSQSDEFIAQIENTKSKHNQTSSGSSETDAVNLPTDYKDLLIETLKEHIEQQKELINIQSETIKALKEQNQVRPNIVQQPSKKQT